MNHPLRTLLRELFFDPISEAAADPAKVIADFPKGDPDRKQVWWSETKQKWVGNDVPDFKADSDPKAHMGPFIMNPEGVGRLFVPIGAVADGPFPEHYEPTESPIANPLHPSQSNNAIAKRFKSDMDKYGTVDQGFNTPCTTPANRTLSRS